MHIKLSPIMKVSVSSSFFFISISNLSSFFPPLPLFFSLSLFRLRILKLEMSIFYFVYGIILLSVYIYHPFSLSHIYTHKDSHDKHKTNHMLKNKTKKTHQLITKQVTAKVTTHIHHIYEYIIEIKSSLYVCVKPDPL